MRALVIASISANIESVSFSLKVFICITGKLVRYTPMQSANQYEIKIFITDIFYTGKYINKK